MNMKLSFKDAFYLAFLFLFCAYIYYAYQQFWSADWTFDGVRIFEYLPQLETDDTARDFILKDREISSIGRPASIASFILNVADWPNNPAGFRRINTLIHLINMLLLALVAMRVANFIPGLRPYAVQFGVVLAVIWGVHPFMASTSFHIVQRMVLLSASFSFLAFIAYLSGREMLEHSSVKGYLWMSLGIVLFGIFGILSKETALLVPLLIGVTEYTLFSHFKPASAPYFSAWKKVFFGVPLVVLALYAVYYLISQEAYLIRPFSLSERMLSEGVILFQYVGQILLPQIKTMGPFQDDLAYIRGLEPITAISWLLWLLLSTVAIVKHKKWPVFSFAVLFFLTGHLLESTVFNLELYYEHRNYIPSIAVLGSIIGVALATGRVLLQSLTYLYAVFLAGLLWWMTTLWGDPILAPIAWSENHPTSVRASQVFTTMLWRSGDVQQARSSIEGAYKRMPDSSVLASNVFVYLCFREGPSEESDSLVHEIITRSPKMHYGRSISQNMFTVLGKMQAAECRALKPAKLIAYLRGLLSNPRFFDKRQRFAFNLLINRFAVLDGDEVGAIKAHMDAYSLKPWTGGLPSIYCKLIQSNQLEMAEAFWHENVKEYMARENKSEIIPSCRH